MSNVYNLNDFRNKPKPTKKPISNVPVYIPSDDELRLNKLREGLHRVNKLVQELRSRN